MAVTYQALGAANQGTSGAGTTNWPVVAANDIGLLLVEMQAGEAVSNISSGWTALASSPQDAGGATTRLSAFWKRATSSSETAPTWNAVTDHFYARIITFRGCLTLSSPIDAEAGGTKAAASTATSIAGVTATQDGNNVLYVAARDNDSGSVAWSAEANASLTSLTERADGGTGLGLGGGLGMWTGNLAAAGASGTLTATVTSCSEAFMCVAFLAQPARLAGSSNQMVG
jgi:hypothetical protein